jgi:hypothetical protein
MIILKILFRSIFLLIAAEPVIDLFQKLRFLVKQYKNEETESVKRQLRNKVITYSIGILICFIIYCVIVATFVDW